MVGAIVAAHGTQPLSAGFIVSWLLEQQVDFAVSL